MERRQRPGHPAPQATSILGCRMGAVAGHREMASETRTVSAMEMVTDMEMATVTGKVMDKAMVSATD
jgi:hypothetical protein